MSTEKNTSENTARVDRLRDERDTAAGRALRAEKRVRDLEAGIKLANRQAVDCQDEADKAREAVAYTEKRMSEIRARLNDIERIQAATAARTLSVNPGDLIPVINRATSQSLSWTEVMNLAETISKFLSEVPSEIAGTEDKEDAPEEATSEDSPEEPTEEELDDWARALWPEREGYHWLSSVSQNLVRDAIDRHRAVLAHGGPGDTDPDTERDRWARALWPTCSGYSHLNRISKDLVRKVVAYHRLLADTSGETSEEIPETTTGADPRHAESEDWGRALWPETPTDAEEAERDAWSRALWSSHHEGYQQLSAVNKAIARDAIAFHRSLIDRGGADYADADAEFDAWARALFVVPGYTTLSDHAGEVVCNAISYHRLVAANTGIVTPQYATDAEYDDWARAMWPTCGGYRNLDEVSKVLVRDAVFHHRLTLTHGDADHVTDDTEADAWARALFSSPKYRVLSDHAQDVVRNAVAYHRLLSPGITPTSAILPEVTPVDDAEDQVRINGIIRHVAGRTVDQVEADGLADLALAAHLRAREDDAEHRLARELDTHAAAIVAAATGSDDPDALWAELDEGGRRVARAMAALGLRVEDVPAPGTSEDDTEDTAEG